MKYVVRILILPFLAFALVACGSNSESESSPKKPWHDLAPGGSTLTMSSSSSDIRAFLEAYMDEKIPDSEFTSFVPNVKHFCTASSKEIMDASKKFTSTETEAQLNQGYSGKVSARYEIIMTEICPERADEFGKAWFQGSLSN